MNLKKESAVKKAVVSEQLKKSPVFNDFNPFDGTEDIESQEAKAKTNEGVKIDNFLNENMIKSWNQQLELIERKKA